VEKKAMSEQPTADRRLDNMAIHMPGKEPHELHPREYAFWHDAWYARVPYSDPHIRLLANLGNHQITEHDDGTLTVSPSIAVSDGSSGHRWHGFLERGVWREA
jgi:hypothetical protein